MVARARPQRPARDGSNHRAQATRKGAGRQQRAYVRALNPRFEPVDLATLIVGLNPDGPTMTTLWSPQQFLAKKRPVTEQKWTLSLCPLMALSGHSTRADEVRYGGKSGHDANGPLCRLMTYCGHWRSNISVGVALIYLCAHVRLFTRTQAFSRATTEHIPQVFWVWGKAVALLRYQLKLKHKSSV